MPQACWLNLKQQNFFFRRMHVTEVVQDNDLVANWGPMRPQSQQIDISMALAGKDALPPPGGFH